MEVDRENCGMRDLGCGISGSPDLTATQDPALVSAQGGASAAFHEGCEAFNLGHHQRGSERGAGRFIFMAKNPHPPLRGTFSTVRRPDDSPLVPGTGEPRLWNREGRARGGFRRARRRMKQPLNLGVRLAGDESPARRLATVISRPLSESRSGFHFGCSIAPGSIANDLRRIIEPCGLKPETCRSIVRAKSRDLRKG